MKKPMIATPVYKLRWNMGARKMRRKVPRRQASMQTAKRVLGSTAVESKMLARRPRHMPLL